MCAYNGRACAFVSRFRVNRLSVTCFRSLLKHSFTRACKIFNRRRSSRDQSSPWNSRLPSFVLVWGGLSSAWRNSRPIVFALLFYRVFFFRQWVFFFRLPRARWCQSFPSPQVLFFFFRILMNCIYVHIRSIYFEYIVKRKCM